MSTSKEEDIEPTPTREPHYYKEPTPTKLLWIPIAIVLSGYLCKLLFS